MATVTDIDQHSDSSEYSSYGSSDSDAYSCDPGLSVIINNMEFEDPRSNLPNGNKDETSLKFILSSLQFDVKVYQNLRAAEIESVAKRYSKMEHKGAFFFIISSHGGEGDVVYGTDGGKVKVHDLQRHFHATKCASLAGKPKVFMIDTYHGNEDEPVYSITSESQSQSFGTCYTTSVMDSADIMTIFASTRGNTAGSNIHVDEGSCFIQTFAQVVKKVSTDYSLTEIVMKVHQKIQNRQIEGTVRLESSFSRRYYIKRGTELNALLELEKELQEVVKGWFYIREETIKEIKEVAEILQEHHRKINISRITGSTASILGGTMAIIGLGLTPLTFGASLVLAAAGIGVSAIGGATVAGASIADRMIEKMKIEDIQKKYNEDYRQLEHIKEKIQEMEQIVEKIYRRYPDVKNNAHEFASILTQFLTITTGNFNAKIAVDDDSQAGVAYQLLKVGSSTAKGIAAFAIPINVILMPFDVAEIVRSYSNLQSGSKTEVIDKLLEHASKLEEQMESIKKDMNMQ